jgi:hypothetical protein
MNMKMVICVDLAVNVIVLPGLHCLGCDIAALSLEKGKNCAMKHLY